MSNPPPLPPARGSQKQKGKGLLRGMIGSSDTSFRDFLRVTEGHMDGLDVAAANSFNPFAAPAPAHNGGPPHARKLQLQPSESPYLTIGASLGSSSTDDVVEYRPEMDSMYDPTTMGMGAPPSSDEEEADGEGEPVVQFQQSMYDPTTMGMGAPPSSDEEEEEELPPRPPRSAAADEQAARRQAMLEQRQQRDLEEQRKHEQVLQQQQRQDAEAQRRQAMLEKQRLLREQQEEQQRRQEEQRRRQDEAASRAAAASVRAQQLQSLSWWEQDALRTGMAKEAWFHGPLDRGTAEGMLSRLGAGDFLVRVSLKNRGYAISVKAAEGKFMHLLVKLDDDGRYVMDDRPFLRLHDVIELHSTKAYYGSLGQFRFQNPCPRTGNPVASPGAAAEAPPPAPPRRSAAPPPRKESYEQWALKDEKPPPPPSRPSRMGGMAASPTARTPPRRSRPASVESAHSLAPSVEYDPVHDDGDDDGLDYEDIDNPTPTPQLSKRQSAYLETRERVLTMAKSEPDKKALPPNPLTWNNAEVLRYIKESGLEDFYEVFYSNGFTGKQTLGLRPESFKAGGFSDDRVRALGKTLMMLKFKATQAQQAAGRR